MTNAAGPVMCPISQLKFWPKNAPRGEPEARAAKRPNPPSRNQMIRVHALPAPARHPPRPIRRSAADWRRFLRLETGVLSSVIDVADAG